MGQEKYLLLFASLACGLIITDGCQMQGISNWLLTVEVDVVDVHEGEFFNRGTTNIQNINFITPGGSVDANRYLNIELIDSQFIISTKPEFSSYEENETSEIISFNVNFQCSGSTNSLFFEVLIQDTNNNAPIFKPTDEYEFTITPPLPPGFQITGCIGDDIIVRDIDLTTERINFTIEENPYFEISYSGRSTTDKEFIGVLTTKSLIRSLPDPIELTIYATDVDRTGDEPITTTGKIRIQADDEFQFPDEPVFSNPYYLATYTNDNQLVIEERITLQQGFDYDVIFSLHGEHSDYFSLDSDDNLVTINVSSSIPNDILRSGRVVLVVRADREHTSGGTATLIVQLPGVPGLEFSQSQYKGRIVDNQLETIQLTLTQGYQDNFNVELFNDFDAYFSTDIEDNVITLLMSPLNSTVIDTNNFISLQVVASNEYSSATTVVTLDIIKDDNVTPVFESAFYSGSYDAETGLTINQIVLIQGYDNTVLFSLEGDPEGYFEISNDESTVTLRTSGISPELWPEEQLLLTLEATKPRSVTATAAISIRLPLPSELAFQSSVYTGTLQDNNITHSPIVLNNGYNDDVNFTLSGDFENYFSLSNADNVVTINLSGELSESVILEHSFLTLTLIASGFHAIPTSTVVVLEIIKQDVTTPVFTERIYRGTYIGTNSLEIGRIGLAQGYDTTVTFTLYGEHEEYFRITGDGNDLSLEIQQDIPPEVIFSEKVLLFNILADKPLTVGANAAVSIAFPQELTDTSELAFSQNTYVGSLENDQLYLENIILETGFELGTSFNLTGDLHSYFGLQYTDNNVSISTTNNIPEELLQDKNFIVLEIEASRESAISTVASIVIDIVKKEIVPPVFQEAYYRGVYANEDLQFDHVISLSQGFDDSVDFVLNGESAVWFSISQANNSVFLLLNSTISEEVLENNDHLLFTVEAIKPGTITATATIAIDLPKEIPETVIMRFTQTSYVGRIENGLLYAPTITILGDLEPIYLNLTGEFKTYFEVSHDSETNSVLLQLTQELPEDIEEYSFILLDLEVSHPEAINGYTVIVIELVKPPSIVIPVFEHAYYIGEYSQLNGLQLDQSIQLIHGFDESVEFDLSGDDSEWFEIVYNNDNNLTLSIIDNGLEEIFDRNHLLFSILAGAPGGITGQTAVVINLSDLTTSIPLRFDENYHKGSIENNHLNLANIYLAEGYSLDMNVSFAGDYKEFFNLTQEENVFSLELLSDLPAEIIESNNVLVFTLEVQIANTRAHTTIILEIVKSIPVSVAFEEAYYVGSYFIKDGFTFDPRITLREQDGPVSFTLEGDDSQWFDVSERDDFVTLDQISPIPLDVLSTRSQLIFVIIGRSANNETAISTIIIKIVDDSTVINFESNIYLGTIQNEDNINVETIVVSNGYSEDVTFTLFGDLRAYFNVTSVENQVTLTLNNVIPDEELPENSLINLELQASAPQAISAHTTIALNFVNELLTFDATYYAGSYTESGGLEFTDLIILTKGYDDDVIFSLGGDDSVYFETVEVNNTVSLSLISPIPPNIVNNEQQLIFTIHADKPRAMSAVGTIVISLINDVTENVFLGFDQISYVGSIENDNVYLEPIILSVGYSENVSFGLYGELSHYFNHSSTNGSVNIFLNDPITEESLPENGIVVLEVHATAPDAISAYATIVLHVEIDDLKNLLFNQPYYVGTYTEENLLVFNDEIILTEGYDETVEFELEGDDSQYFEIVVVSSNSRSLRTIFPIPSAVIANNQQLIFTVRAESATMMTRATIVISLLDEFTEDPVLGFDRIAYVGTINDNSIDIGPITLSEGYSSEVSFSLIGEHRSYFNLSNSDEVVTIELESPIPEDLIPENRLIILSLQASITNTIAAHATIVFEVIIDDPTLEFSKFYYTGYYTERDSLAFEETIALAEGYSEDVQFHLEGDDSQYFEIVVVSSNSRSLRMLSPIPSAVIANNQQLIFTIRAERTGTVTTRSTIVISLLDEFTEDPVLGFDRVAYVGTINDSSIDIGPIRLSEGYSSDVSFSMYGDLRSYFNLSNIDEVVTISLDSPIPEDLIPENRLIILSLQASITNTMAAHATIVFEVIIDEPITALEQLEFSKVYYTGYYTERDSLAFEEIIALTEGYNEDVQFRLEGDDSQYFEIVVLSSNSRSLRMLSPIPSAVIANNQQLIFIVSAERTGAVMTRATIVISLLDEFTEDPVLGFDRVAYVGTINDSSIDIGPIRLSEGYSSDVSFSMYGDLRSYFNLSNIDEVVTISLDSPIPEDLIPENRLIILSLQASITNTMAAHATIVFEVIIDEPITALEQLEFSKVYYTGYYTERDSLAFEEIIALTEGYNEDVQFRLEGDDSQYFEIVVLSSNSRSLRMLSPIPSAVIANNQQLIFIVSAERTGAVLTRATIVISLLDEFTEDPVLGFDRVAYVGTINDSSIDIGLIRLSEGYSSDVSFSLYGELRSYFNLSNIDEIVTISLDSPIPEDFIPENRLIILSLQASITNTMAAHATIVFEVIIDEPVTALEQLEFSKVYYTGYYTERDSLAFEEIIALTEGYNEDVQFRLEGDDSQYFEIVVLSSNSRSLRMLSPIPSAVIANNQQLIFIVSAERTGAVMTRATIVISLLDEFTEDPVLGFDRVAYVGTINDSSIDIGPIRLSEGYSSDVSFSMYGDLRSYFNLSNIDEVVTISLDSPIPEDLIPENRLIILSLQASITNTMAAHATIVFEVIIDEPITALEQLEFSKVYYTGYYTERDSLAFEEIIALTEGYNEDVQFRLEGDDSQYFEIVVLSSNSRSLRMLSPIPSAVIANNQQLIFIVSAERTGAVMTRATIVISLLDEFTEDPVLGFDRVAYVGTINDSSIDIGPIRLSEGYSSDVSFSMYGDLRSYFNLSNIDEVVTISLDSPIPEDLIPENRLIILSLQASITNTMAAHATIVFEVIIDEPITALEQLEFSKVYYTGYYTERDSLAFEEIIALTEGYNEDVQFRLEGDDSQYFEIVVLSSNSRSLRMLSPIPSAVIANNQQLIFIVSAERTGAVMTRATIVISLLDEFTEDPVLGFDRVAYVGTINESSIDIGPIRLSEGYSSDVSFSLYGDLRSYFNLSSIDEVVTISLDSPIPEDLIPENRLIILSLQASITNTIAAHATIVFEVIINDPTTALDQLKFSQNYYSGFLDANELTFVETISLVEGFNQNVVFSLKGDSSLHFEVDVIADNEISLKINITNPPDVSNKHPLIFEILAEREGAITARATIVIALVDEDCTPSDGARFDRVLYQGILDGGVVIHDSINLSGFTGTAVEILGDYQDLFTALLENGQVKVSANSPSLSEDITFIPLELQAGSASAVLLLDVSRTEEPTLPSVSFSATSYVFRVEISQTGLIGAVSATADNGERITYRINIEDNDHLQQRLFINNDGELRLSAPVNTGVYRFEVIATTVFSQATAMAPVAMTVDIITTCGEDDFLLPPLLTLDRDEESAHMDLVTLNRTHYVGCRYELSNRWPISQSWLYVDENGLHTTAIDREDESIAFMALSQVQVALNLVCDSDNDATTRSKRSLNDASRLDHLGPYDYGDKKWILTNSIQYEPRRTLVNLIVNDINDNAPIFVGKENEPIVVGYPIADLEERILPRALIVVQAIDADVGINAALVYQSTEDVLAVSPYTGFVHVRDKAGLQNNTKVRVLATDRNGEGLTSYLDILVRLLDTNHIAVVTIQNAFLEDENAILANLSSAVGYEVKALRTTVLSDVEIESGERRKKRQATISTGSSLQIFIYGLIEQYPVDVQQLAEDVSNSNVTALIIADTVTLEDYLDSLEACPLPGRDTGFMIATIILSVLLFILIVAAAVWFFLKWRAERKKYEQFSDENSIESRNESVTVPKPVDDNAPKPRINLEDLKRSERRLQEMLEAPVEEVSVEPVPASVSTPAESKIVIPEMPIVIQSIDKLKAVEESDDEDEFGERLKDKRKSVVTFNENVEKIIHVEDTPDEGELEVYKL